MKCPNCSKPITLNCQNHSQPITRNIVIDICKACGWFCKRETTMHSHTYSNPSGTYDVIQLIADCMGRQSELVAIADLKGISYSKKSGFSKKRLLAVKMYAILIDQNNKVIDGRHRVISLIQNNISHVKAIRVTAEDLAAAKI